MNWKTKAQIQNVIAALPESLSQLCYYQLQSWFGDVRGPVRDYKTVLSCKLVRVIQESVGDLSTAKILEIGTGRRLNLSIIFWLLGAKQMFTADINRYLKPECVISDINNYRQRREWLMEILSEGEETRTRLDQLLELDQSSPRRLLTQLFDLCGITYMAPVDVSNLDSTHPHYIHDISVHCSQSVLEHIPGESLRRLLKSASVLLKEGGLCVHHIVHRDHFSFGDSTISSVNFLQFSDEEWNRYAGNRFMYMNRLRSSDYLRLFRECGFEIRHVDTFVEPYDLELIEKGKVPLAKKFQGMSPTDLATGCTTIVAVPRHENL